MISEISGELGETAVQQYVEGVVEHHMRVYLLQLHFII